MHASANRTGENAIPLLAVRAPTRLTRATFGARFRTAYVDAAFRAEDRAITHLEEIAWQAYTAGR